MIPKDIETDYFLRVVYKTFTSKINSKEYNEINDSLQKVSVSEAPISLLIGYLEVTQDVKNELPYRNTFYFFVKEEIKKREKVINNGLVKLLK